jgi:hypothetical protein
MNNLSPFENFFTLPRPGNYLLVLAAGVLLALVVFFLTAKKRDIPVKAALTAAALSLILGAFLARLQYFVVEHPFWDEVPGLFFSPQDVREFGFMGAVAGVLLAALITNRLFKMRGVGNAMALPGLLAVVFARMGEIFVPFGTGGYVEATSFQFIPLSIPDGFGDYVFSVFLVEALWALLILLYIRFSANYPSPVDLLLALTLFFAGQIVLESIRAEALRAGFIRVQQAVSAAGLFTILLYCQHRTKEGRTIRIQRVVLFIIVALLVVAGEFALDRTPWADIYVYLGMIMVVMIMAGIVVHAVLAREEQLLGFDRCGPGGCALQ